ncbi:Oral-facial-digital syndrome 1 protein [Phytophthora citrophthora]|uniref:Oral-facial-digital syndrome 1 protein n=1 Tax=Phytophthora citrophthora TaxID=4793 RepID=A0AAD9LM86_9STRA|nr:Oral-facial-digital syndrome 1 protein [Phytophthora citrophthora]
MFCIVSDLSLPGSSVETMNASSLSRDEDGRPLMSLEELKEGMFQSIRDNGTVELIRAQLRRRFIEKLQQQRRLDDDPDEENNADRANRDAAISTPDEKLVQGLVAEYLACKGLENTLAVFVPEIGGSRNQVDSTTILEILHVNSSIQNKLELERANTGQSLLLILIRELARRFQLATMDSETQTVMDCFDHRIVLENQLRRVENTYLAECAAQKLEPQKSLEERMVQYQREYDGICEKRLQQELERYKSTEVAFVRAEERKRFDREVDNLRSSLLQEYRNKQERLQERERDLELALVGRRTELETSLFETRQSLFKDMERLRVKEAELQVKVESDFRHFATETQRFQLWEESVRTQEANLESIVAQAMREKERAWNLERQQALQDIQTKQDDLIERERSLVTETGTLKSLTMQVGALQQEIAAVEAALSKSRDDLRTAQNSAVQLEKDRHKFEERVTELEEQLDEQKSNLLDTTAANARLLADRSMAADEISRYKQKSTEFKEQLKFATAEVKSLQQQILDMKFEEANAVVAERKKFMQVLDEERERSNWKENELLAKARELQSRLAESEALAEKYQSQYEDEKVHVESLRHDVSGLNSLLTQAQATINAKHGAPKDFVNIRATRGAGRTDPAENDYQVSSDYQPRGSERTFMMKMMEMMANFQDERTVQRGDSRRERTETLQSAPAVVDPQTQPVLRPLPTVQASDGEQEEAKRLKEDQARIERDLIEQREYEKKKQARMEEQEREMAEQNRQFEEKLARMRQERVEEEVRLEEQRKKKQNEEEAKLQEELARQRAAVQEAMELQQRLAEQRLADEQQRLQEEEAHRERRLAEERKFNDEIEAKRRQQQLEDELAAKQREERAEEERQRQQMEQQEQARIQEDQERIHLEHDKMATLEAEKLKQKEKDRQREEQMGLEEEKQRKETEKAQERIESNASVDEAPATVDEDDVSTVDEEKTETIVDEITMKSNDDPSDHEELMEMSVTSAASVDNSPEADDAVTDATPTADPPAKTQEEEEQERQEAAEQAKKKEDEDVIDVYRQRVLARKAAEKQQQMEQDAENERKAKEEEERQRLQLLGDASESDQELELSGGSFAESSSSSTTIDNDRDRRTSRQEGDFNYRQTHEEQDRFSNLRGNEYQHRRDEPQRSFDWRSSREIDVSSLSSGRSTIGGSTMGTAFTSIDSSNGLRRGGRSTDSHTSDRENNQSENGFDRYERNELTRRRAEDRRQVNRFSDHQESIERGTTRNFEPSSNHGVAEHTSSLGYGRPVSYAESRISGKVDSIREPESPVPVRATVDAKNDKESTREVPESRTPSLCDNQDEHHSPTNSVPPTSPFSDSDSFASKIRDRYPIPSSVSSDRRRRPSSPCSSISTTRTTSSTSRSVISKGITHSDMSDLRDDLYAFRKQMREVFIRVEDMVDVHRSLFKSDPSTGTPVYRQDLEQEAEEQANEAFKQLANLRKHFTRLAKGFERSQSSSDGWSVPIQERRTHTPIPESPSRLKRAQKSLSNHSSEGDTLVKTSDAPEDNGSDCISVTSDNTDEASTMEHSPITREICQLNTNFSTDSTSSFVSPQLQSRWRKNSIVSSVTDISARTKTQRGSSLSDESSLHDQSGKTSESDTDSIFKDFDQRMEQIRSSLNAIADGKKPNHIAVDSSAVAPKNFTSGGADSPIRAMMAATRTRSTLREASRISRGLEGDSDEEENSRPHSSDREAELRQLLQELNHINAGTDND